MLIYPEIYNESNVNIAHKWMWNPQDDIVLITNTSYSNIYEEFKVRKPAIDNFFNWIKFIRPKDENYNGFLFVFAQNIIGEYKVLEFLKALKITDNIRFNMTNSNLKNMLGINDNSNLFQ